MEKALLDIVAALQSGDKLDNRALTKLINKHNKRILEEQRQNAPGEPLSYNASQELDSQSPISGDSAFSHLATPAHPTRPLSKKRLLEYYLAVKKHKPEKLDLWGITPEMDERVMRTLQMKPRRTASGVATITVLTKPWKCSSDCLYCPSDLRMPKSYLADEPACQRAERNYFDPYLQVRARLQALNAMGHVTDKVEVIILGGTWSDYPQAYQIWFVRELFRALNDASEVHQTPEVACSRSAKTSRCKASHPEEELEMCPKREDPHKAVGELYPANGANGLDTSNHHAGISERIAWYEQAGLSCDPDVLQQQVAPLQQEIACHNLTYNQAFDALYGASTAWKALAPYQTATFSELQEEHTRNEAARHRVVGLVIETRPDNITLDALIFMRALGCTKIQMGIQSLDEAILRTNKRHVTQLHIQQAFEACRLLGFKTHVHAMVNLYGATPESDKQDYRRLVTEAPYQPDEIKLYPCALIEGTHLCTLYEQGAWKPYPEETLVDVLVADTCATPPFTRISRMIRDFSAGDIVAGNKKVNLRQMVEERIDSQGYTTEEIRHREISLSEADPAELRLDVIPYETTISREYFLQWVTPENRIAGFLRLSLPHQDVVQSCIERYSNPASSSAGTVASDAPHPTLPPASAPCPTRATKVRTHTGGQPLLAFPIALGEAMIREVHIYGRAERLHSSSGSAQHQGLGRKLIERACALARDAGYTKINVISAIGTRGYYRTLKFYDHGLYQQRALS